MYSRYRWFVVFVFFLFMLLHQTDLLMINSLIKPIMDTFHLDEMQIGFIQSGSLLVAACLFPVWGYLYDRYARAKLLALAALIWGFSRSTRSTTAASNFLALNWSRLSEQKFRVDKWSLCRGQAAARSGGRLK